MPLNTQTLTDRERMRALSPRLKHRVIIQQAQQTVYESDDPGSYLSSPPMQRTYTDLKTVWAGIVPKQSLMDFVSATRAEQDLNRITHEFWVRWESVRGLGAAFSSAFSVDFNTVQQLNPIKSDFFFFLKTTANKGRRFQCKETRWDERSHEYIMVRCMELEEVGTGGTP